MPELDYASLLKDQREGQEFQQCVSPQSGVTLAGVEFNYAIVPARYVAGDAVDYFLLPDGRVLAYLLDVSGCGTAAALLGMFIKSTVRQVAQTESALTPAGVLHLVNQALLAADMQKYATMVCVLLAPEQGYCEWSQAGHTPRPVFFTEHTAELLIGEGQPVGLFAEACYSNQRLAMPSNFSVWVFSDGILDCLPNATFVAREATLVEAVQTAAGSFATMLDEQAWFSSARTADDRSVLVISRNGYAKR